jgi:uncharacterized protein (TIGR03084 family)
MSGSPSAPKLLLDLEAEHADLDALVSALPAAEWDRVTPAEGWSVRDTISHLAFFDEQGRLAATEPDAFRAGLADVIADLDAFVDAGPEQGRTMPAGEVLAWWREARRACLDALAAVPESTRLPWYGPDMNTVSFATARLMETWAHGQDVADALGVRRTPSERLRHIAHLGVRTMGFSFAMRGRDAPSAPVRVELTGPGGDSWTWGPEDSADRVSGPALGFCLLVTQRRHLADVGLESTGDVATEWLSIAQAFAGPAGNGRAPGLPPA